MRPATSALGRTATTSTDALLDPASVLETLRTGELEVVGRLVGSSNHAMVVRVLPDAFLSVWKPTRGERPLFDFPIGTLTRREVAAHLVSETLGWGIVPPTLLREGPFGEGMVQLWIDVDPEADVIAMVNDEDPRLRRVAAFDAVVNNTDRNAGHLLPIAGGHLFAVDHGVTFSVVPKLRTVLWGWEGEPFDPEELAGLGRVADALGSAEDGGALARDLAELISGREIAATRARVDGLLATGRFPSPSPDWPAIPWPPY